MAEEMGWRFEAVEAMVLDVLIIGAGIAGAGVGAELSVDHSVLLLETEERPGAQATGRSAALYSEIYGNSVIRALTQASRSFFLDGDGERPFVSERGCLHIATESQIAALRAFGAQEDVAPFTRWLDGADARSLVPVLKPGVVAAALQELHAYDLDVDAIHSFFLRRIRANGGVLSCSTCVTDCSFDGEYWIVSAGEREFRGRILINAAGAWGDVVARLSGAVPVGLQPMRRSALIVAPPAGANGSNWPAVIDVEEQFYFKPEAGKLLMSPADETPSDPCDAFPDQLDLAIAIDRIQQVADIPVRRIDHSWAGLRTFARDRTPVAGYDSKLPNFFWLVGQGGYGIQTSPALSRLAASLVRRQPIPDDLVRRGLDDAQLDPARFRRDSLSSGSYFDKDRALGASLGSVYRGRE